MMISFTGLSASLALTLLALFPATSSDRATWPQCKRGWDGRGRVLELEDDDVTLLNLKNCNITTLPSDAFNTTVPKLEEIHLDENNLQDIDASVFIPVSHVTLISLSYNKLRSIPIFGAYSLFPNLEELYLDNNRILSINDDRTFSLCENLERLYLTHNQIEYIAPDIFKPLINLESIDLSYNKLTSVSDSVFHVKSLKVIRLDNNLISYIPPNAFSDLSQLFLDNNRLSFLYANFSSVITRPPARAIAMSLYNNPWQCACLLELMEDVKGAKSGARYAYWEYNGVLKSCEFRGMVCHRHTLEENVKKLS
ncbi:leucine-rich repeat-containing protein 15-like [Leguminivora glycinivorella]|uniref:leucine-rich repeat-containing protein 15-like n=1 Tax=Leguminivora glycinivorella TaxID=1035111 RepID=UPI00200E6C91|nr:leucine-rich repeat-containing protein 15-like [Leguminivora glycinivorella]